MNGAYVMRPRAAFAVKHKQTGLLFAGFDPANGEPTWSDASTARAYPTPADARGQALLFACRGYPVQKKPVVLAQGGAS